MNCRRITSCVAIVMCFALAARAIAQEAAVSESADEATSNSQDLLAPSVTSEGSTVVDGDQAKPMPQLQEWQRKQRQLLEQQKTNQSEYQRALEIFQGMQQEHPAKLQAERNALEQQVQILRAQLAQMAAQQQKPKAAPLPENAQTRVFALRYSKAPQLVGVLGGIVGDRGLRMAVDERSNSLVVSSDDKTMSIVDALVQKLDRSAGESVATDAAPSETLQLRIVWLLDGVHGAGPLVSQVSPQVLEALQKLGFQDPSVVCQQVTSLTLGGENRRGQFRFTVPVIVAGELWQFGGSGQISPLGNERFSLHFELAVDQGGRGANIQNGRLGGSIYSPLGHYTVMGTTTFVASDVDDRPVPQEGRTPQQRQYLSAFVVYLDRAPEFPADKLK